ncbi:hypothetical protein H0H93_008069 [Arthromyces matolae]|nr:hypothetical protein H0H93_008069 [Arthromyces matolae]
MSTLSPADIHKMLAPAQGARTPDEDIEMEELEASTDNDIEMKEYRTKDIEPTGRCIAVEVPPEILELIFRACLEGVIVKLHTYEVLNFLRVTHVCRYWRNVATSIPALWSSLDLEHFSNYDKSTLIPNGAPRRAENNVFLTRLWLSRSKNHALTLRFPYQYTFNMNPVYWEIDSTRRRWGNIIVHMETDPIIFELFALRPGHIHHRDAPLLERIEFRTRPGITLPPSDEKWINLLTPILASHESLREIVWTSYFPRNVQFIFWPHLRSFTIDQSVDTREFLVILTRCPVIENVRLGCYEDPKTYRATIMIKLPYLHSLHLHAEPGSDVGILLDSLTLPSLRSLEMVPPRDDLSLRRLGARSSCKLTHLGLLNGAKYYGTVLDFDPLIYVRTPCVTTIRSLSTEQIIMDDFIRLLTWDPKDESKQHLPFLTEIDPIQCYTKDSLVSEMLISRFYPFDRAHPRVEGPTTIRRPARLTFAKVDLFDVAHMVVEGRRMRLPETSYKQDSAVLKQAAADGLVVEGTYAEYDRIDL